MHPYYGIWNFPPKNAHEIINKEVRYLKSTAGRLAMQVLIREQACDIILLGDSPESEKVKIKAYKEELGKFASQIIVPMYNQIQVLKLISRYS